MEAHYFVDYGAIADCGLHINILLYLDAAHRMAYVVCMLFYLIRDTCFLLMGGGLFFLASTSSNFVDSDLHIHFRGRFAGVRKLLVEFV